MESTEIWSDYYEDFLSCFLTLPAETPIPKAIEDALNKLRMLNKTLTILS